MNRHLTGVMIALLAMATLFTAPAFADPAVAVEFAARAHPWRRRAMPLRRRCLE